MARFPAPSDRPSRPPRRPLVPLALAAVSGCALAPLVAPWLATGTAFVSSLLTVWISRGRSRRRPAPGLSVAAALLAWGGLYASRTQQAASPPPPPQLAPGAIVELEGSLCAEPRRRFQDWELTLRLPDGRRVLVLTQPGDRLVPGDRLRCLARALSPPRPAGPDEFDLSAWLARRQISQRLRTTEVQVVRPGSGPLAWIAHAKQAGRALLREQVSRRNQPFFRAILLGEPLGPGSSLRQAFRDSGTAHLLSISGLHVGFVALLGLLIGRVLALSRSERSALAILFVVAYALATGLRVPIVRAGVGGVVFLIAPSRGDSWNRLACALLVVLAWDPASLYDVGLVLSFGTVAGLIALAPPLARLADPGADPLGTGPRQSPGGQVYRFLLATLLTAVAAFLASAPLLAATIGEVPLPALWLGPPAIALFGLVLGLALIGVVLGVVLSPVATPFLALADLLTDLLRSLVVQGTAGLSPFEVPQLSPLVYLALAGLLGLTALRLERSRSPASA